MSVNDYYNENRPDVWNIHVPPISAFLDPLGTLESISSHLETSPVCIIEGTEDLNGYPGVTSMAREFAYRHQNDYDIVWWMHGRREAALVMEYTLLGNALDTDDSPSFKTPTQTQELLVERERWLLIFDDVPDPSMIVPLLPETITGHVLITTSQPSPESEIPKIPIAPLELSTYLNRYEARCITESSVPELLRASPYALDMLSATTNFSDYTMDQMLSTIEKALAKLSDPDYDDALQMVIRYPLSVVAARIPAAKDFLAVCCFLAPDDIPRFLLRQGEGIVTGRLARTMDDDDTFHEMTNLLCALGILTRDDDHLTIHTSFQRVLRAGMEESAAKNWLNAVLRLLEQTFPEDVTHERPSEVCTRLVPHLLHAVDFAEELEAVLPLASTMLYQAGLYLHAHKLLPHAQMCYLRSINIAERKLGTVHPDVAIRVNSLGVVEHQLGDLDAAHTCFERAMDICENLYGSTKEARYANIHDTTLTMPLRNLCMILEEKGDIKRAQRAFEKAMTTFVEVYGWNHSVVAECAHCFGNTWMKLGNFTRAKSCFVKAVRAEENAHNCDNVALALYLHSLGAALLKNKEPDSAVDQLERALRLERTTNGDDSSGIPTALIHLGHAYREVGRLEDAEATYREALNILEQDASDDRGAEIAKLLASLGIVQLGRRQFGQARLFLEQAVARQAELHGDDSELLVTVLVNLGKAMDGLQAPTQAKDSYQRALTILEEKNPENHSDHATILYRLGRSHEMEREYATAVEFYERAMNMDTRHLGQEHAHVARDAAGLGSALAAQNDTIVAMGHLTLALDIYETAMGKDHPKTRAVRKKLDKISH